MPFPPSVYDTRCDGPGLLATTTTWSRIKCHWRRFAHDYFDQEPLPPKVDLTGKNIIITGSNSGIGKEAALKCAEWGASVIMACRDPPSHEQHPEDAIDEIIARSSGRIKRENIEWWEVDLASFESVRTFGEKWQKSGRVCDVLLNNAGLTTSNHIVTRDGYELTNQVDFLSHCLITFYILPTMKDAYAPRIVNTSSCFHNGGVLDFANFDYEKKTGKGYHGVMWYCHAKLRLLIWTFELQRRLTRSDKYRHVVTHAIHPGFVHSGIWYNPALQKLPKILRYLLFWAIRKRSIDVQQGSLALLYAGLHPERGLPRAALDRAGGPLEGESLAVGARYYNRTREAEYRPEADDALVRARLWQRVLEDLDTQAKGLAEDLPSHPPGLE